MKRTILAITLMVFSASTQVFALDCEALKNGEIQTKLQGEDSSQKFAVVDSYQFNAIEVGSNNLVLTIFDRRTPNLSVRSVISGKVSAQIVSSELETADGSYQVRCK